MDGPGGCPRANGGPAGRRGRPGAVRLGAAGRAAVRRGRQTGRRGGVGLRPGMVVEGAGVAGPQGRRGRPRGAPGRGVVLRAGCLPCGVSVSCRSAGRVFPMGVGLRAGCFPGGGLPVRRPHAFPAVRRARPAFALSEPCPASTGGRPPRGRSPAARHPAVRTCRPAVRAARSPYRGALAPPGRFRPASRTRRSPPDASARRARPPLTGSPSAARPALPVRPVPTRRRRHPRAVA